MKTKEFKNEKEKDFILNEIKNSGVRGIIVKDFGNTGEGVIKY